MLQRLADFFLSVRRGRARGCDDFRGTTVTVDLDST